ncbi:MAG: hypothetical protein U0559_16375 [Anaerolineae bacterium]
MGVLADTDLGMHDACRGMDLLYHTDWADLFKVYCEAAQHLDQRPLQQGVP